MTKLKIFNICVIGLLVFATLGQAKNEKRAQTGMPFLSISLDARATAMGTANIAMETGVTAFFYNPAGLAWFDRSISLMAGQLDFIADIKYQYGAIAYSPARGEYGVFGLTAMGVDYGDMQGTIRADNNQGYLDTGIFNPKAYAIGLGYSKALSNKFAVGGDVRYVYQNLIGGLREFGSDQSTVGIDTDLNILAFDFGILYKTGYKSLNFGMNVRNFSAEKAFIDEQFQLPLSFEIGLSMDMIDFTDFNPDRHNLLFSMDAKHPRDYPEQIDLGLEYVYNHLLALRVGYTTPTDEEGISMGVGINQDISGYGISIDYAYTSFGVFDDVHRFTLNLSL
ncbi:MAG: PorV/PorQ family protein [Calditrichae bacterium]|nr:PorV/PorQ family protein [Calditrichota bacterium]MCB9057620.1 PorV/PorQ family protein [Calditrichia bacterium]